MRWRGLALFLASQLVLLGCGGDRVIMTDVLDARLMRRFFGLSNGYWLRAQAAYDTEVAEDVLADQLARIRPGGSRLRKVMRGTLGHA